MGTCCRGGGMGAGSGPLHSPGVCGWFWGADAEPVGRLATTDGDGGAGGGGMFGDRCAPFALPPRCTGGGPGPESTETGTAIAVEGREEWEEDGREE